MSFVVPEEISMLVSSDPEAGASNRSDDGSYFEVQLQDGLTVPKDALNVNISVEEATVWWVVPNITSDNDKFYVTGPAEGTIIDKITLGYPQTAQFSLTVVSPNVSTLVIQNLVPSMPVGDFVIGDIFRPNEGVSSGILYTITGITSDTTNYKSYTVSGNLAGNISPSEDDFSRVRAAGTITNFVLTIDEGLYDLSGLNQALLRELENAGAQIKDSNDNPLPLLTLSPDDATQKVEIRFNYSTVSIDFSQQNTCREILGFDSAVYGPYATVPYNLVAPNVAALNQVNYFLIHSDLTNKGIRFNNNYNQTISQVLIDVAPGSQIISKPFNPAKINAPELTGATRTNLRFWITDDKNRRINTNNEYWTARIVIHYLKPFVVGESK
jgi:hypothetical protein